MRTKREDFFPSELYWLDRVGPVSRLSQFHGGVPTDVTDLVTIDPNGSPLAVALDRLIEPEWAEVIGYVFGKLAAHRLRAPDDRESVILDARVTLTWPTSAGIATWKGHDAPYMILNLYDLLMKLALAGAGRIQLYGYPHPRPKNRKFIPMPWRDVYVVALLIERGGAPRLEYEPESPQLLDVEWP